jgi:hypothetical protein
MLKHRVRRYHHTYEIAALRNSQLTTHQYNLDYDIEDKQEQKN